MMFITPEGFDTVSPNNQMATTMMDHFLSIGMHIHLIQSVRNEANPPLPKILLDRPGFMADNVKRKKIDKNNFIKRYLNEARFSFSALKAWRKVKDADIVFVQSCPTVFFTIFLLKMTQKKPIVFNLYDLWPDHAYNLKALNKPIFMIMDLMQRFVYRNVQAITVLGDDMKRLLEKKKVSAQKIHIVPPWYDDRFTYDPDRAENQFIRKFAISDEYFWVQFAGTIGHVFDYKTVLGIAAKLADQKKIRFQIVGEGACKKQFMEEARDLKLENIAFFPLQPLDMVIDVYTACDVALIPLKKGVIGNGIPSKAPILMACAKAIVNSVEEESSYATMFNENKIGFAVNNGDTDAIAEVIVGLFDSPEEAKQIGQRAREYAKERFSSTICLAQFVDIFRETISAEKE